MNIYIQKWKLNKNNEIENKTVKKKYYDLKSIQWTRVMAHRIVYRLICVLHFEYKV